MRSALRGQSAALAIQQRVHLYRRRRRILQRAYAAQQRYSPISHRGLRSQGNKSASPFPATSLVWMWSSRRPAPTPCWPPIPASASASSFTLDLLRTINACSVPAAQGATVKGVVSATVPFLAYRIAASSGDMLSLRSSSSTAGFASQMELYDPTGVRLDSGVFSLSRKAAASGNYTVILGAASPLTAGGYSFAWQLLNQPAGASPLACGGSTKARSPHPASSATTRSPPTPATSSACSSPASAKISRRRSRSSIPPAHASPPAPTSHRSLRRRQLSGSREPFHQLPRPARTACLPASQRPLFAGLAHLRPDHPAPGERSRTARHLHLQRQRRRPDSSRWPRHRRVFPLRRNVRPGRHAAHHQFQRPVAQSASANGVYTILVRDRNGLNLGSYRVSLQDDTNACPVTDTEAPVITLISPTGGEVLPGGTTFAYSGSPTITSAWPHTISRSPPMPARPSPPRSPAWRQSPGLRLDHPRRHRAQPHRGTPRHRHRCAGNAQSASSDCHPNRFRLHTEQHRHVDLRRTESPYPGIVERRQDRPIHLGLGTSP